MANHTASYPDLLAQCALKKPQALQQLYHLEAGHLLALGTRLLGRSSDAQELVRESFVLIWHHADAYEENLGSARAWIYSIFRFKALQRLQQSPTLSPFNHVDPRLLIPSSAPAELRPFQYLTETARNMLGLAYLNAYSTAEIAKKCQVTIKQTQDQIQQALRHLTQRVPGWQSSNTEHLVLLGMYCLGLLRHSPQNQTAQQLLSDNPSAAHDLLLWEDCLSALCYTLETTPAPAQLLERIYQDLALPASPAVTPPTPKPAAAPIVIPEPAVASEPASSITSQATQNSAKSTRNKPSKHRWWYGAATLVALLFIAIIVWLLSPKAPIIQRIEMRPLAGAILQAPNQSSTPGWVLTVDPEGHVLFMPKVKTEVATGHAVQLWTQSPNQTQIRSLGTLDPNQPVTITKEKIGEVQAGQLFEMTLEPEQGMAEPSGAVLFIGRVVSFGDYTNNPIPAAKNQLPVGQEY